MNRWHRRTLAAITVGGAFFGLTLTLGTLMAGKQNNAWNFLILAVVSLLY